MKFIVEGLQSSRYFKLGERLESAKFSSMEDATGFGSREDALQAVKQAAINISASASGKPLPKWISLAIDASMEELEQRFSTSTQPEMVDFLGVFEVCYVRSSRGWLCRPHKSMHGGNLCWAESFGFAATFPDPESALTVLAGMNFDGVSIVRASSLFTRVNTMKASRDAMDPIRDAIASACEARDISGALDEVAKERVSAMSHPPKSKPRL
jgi:hypothetical protein